MRGPEGAPVFAQSSRELKGLQRELGDVHALRCVLVPGFARTCRARLEFAAVPGRGYPFADVELSPGACFAWSRSGCSWRVTLSGAREWRPGGCGSLMLAGSWWSAGGCRGWRAIAAKRR